MNCIRKLTFWKRRSQKRLFPSWIRTSFLMR